MKLNKPLFLSQVLLSLLSTLEAATAAKKKKELKNQKNRCIHTISPTPTPSYTLTHTKATKVASYKVLSIFTSNNYSFS